MIQYDKVEVAAKLAVYSGEHMLLLGKPGSGKSQWAEQFFKRYEGKKFSTQFSRWSDETVIFGPPNFQKIRELGEISYNQTGILVADYAYLDELFDASDVLLRTLLGILHERKFERGSFSCQVPLKTAIATSNFSRSTEMTEAVIDRFAIRVHSPQLNPETRKLFWGDYSEQPVLENSITQKSIIEVRNRAKAIKINNDNLIELGNRYAHKLGFSERREAKAVWLLKVAAAMNNRDHIVASDVAMVIPLLIPLGNDLDQRQEQLREEIKAELTRIEHEEHQLNELLAATKPPEGGAEKQARWATKQIQAIRGYNPCSEKVDKYKHEVLDMLTAIHSKSLKELGMII